MVLLPKCNNLKEKNTNSALNQNNNMWKLIKNPMGLYLLWIILLLVFCLIGIPVLSIGSPGGDQITFMLLARTADVAVAGFIIISSLSPIVYWNWYKKYMFIPLLIPLLVVILLVWWMIHIYISNGYYFAW